MADRACERAARIMHTAALKFAQNGLLVKRWRRSSCCAIASGGTTSRAHRESFGSSRKDSAGSRELGDHRGRTSHLLRGIVLTQVGARHADATAPLFSLVGRPTRESRRHSRASRRAFRHRHHARIEPGEFLGIVARGRVVIYCRNFRGSKVYLSSLSDGDCFGEFSFFTGDPRAATVEALDDVTYFEIERSDFDGVLDRFPKLTRAMLDFYKDRVAATLLAKSEVFGILRPTDRRWLLERLELERRSVGEVIVCEGDASDGFI